LYANLSSNNKLSFKKKFDSPIHTTRVDVYLKKDRFLVTDFNTCILNQSSLLVFYLEENNVQTKFIFFFDSKRLIKGINNDLLKRRLKLRIFYAATFGRIS
jgi:hypothetical protein